MAGQDSGSNLSGVHFQVGNQQRRLIVDDPAQLTAEEMDMIHARYAHAQEQGLAGETLQFHVLDPRTEFLNHTDDLIWRDLCLKNVTEWWRLQVPPHFLARLKATIAQAQMPNLWVGVTLPSPMGGQEIAASGRRWEPLEVPPQVWVQLPIMQGRAFGAWQADNMPWWLEEETEQEKALSRAAEEVFVKLEERRQYRALYHQRKAFEAQEAREWLMQQGEESDVQQDQANVVQERDGHPEEWPIGYAWYLRQRQPQHHPPQQPQVRHSLYANGQFHAANGMVDQYYTNPYTYYSSYPQPPPAHGYPVRPTSQPIRSSVPPSSLPFHIPRNPANEWFMPDNPLQVVDDYLASRHAAYEPADPRWHGQYILPKPEGKRKGPQSSGQRHVLFDLPGEQGTQSPTPPVGRQDAGSPKGPVPGTRQSIANLASRAKVLPCGTVAAASPREMAQDRAAVQAMVGQAGKKWKKKEQEGPGGHDEEADVDQAKRS